jgi:hypothetical protein
MRKGIQNLLESAGTEACCALCLVELAERYTHKAIDPIVAFDYAIGKKWITYYWDDPKHKDNFRVQEPAQFFSHLTGRRWEYRHVDAGYPLADGELEIQVYELGKSTHFCLADWDSLISSRTKREGKLVTKRVLSPR